MIGKEYEKWYEENGVAESSEWYNGSCYKFVTLKDGWIGIFEYDNGIYYPLIQADSMLHAIEWCYRRERIDVPITELVPREEAYA